MYKKLILFLVLIIATSFLAGCTKTIPISGASQTVTAAPKAAISSQQTAKPQEEKKDPIKNK